MKERKQGFTLIELLAVIVILAIIALIAIPIVLNLIEISRKGSFTRSAEGVLKSAKLYYSSSLLTIDAPIEIEFYCNNTECISSEVDEKENNITLDVDGNMGTGTVNITQDGKISFELDSGVYCAVKKVDEETITVEKRKCNEVVVNPPKDLSISSKIESMGGLKLTGVVSNKIDEIASCEFSIDDGNKWEKATLKGNTYEYTFTGLEINKTYTVKMKVTNTKGESETKEIEVIIPQISISEEDIEVEPSGWAVSKTVKIKDDYISKIDTNIYKIVYKLNDGEYEEYTHPIGLTAKGNIVVDIQKKEDNTSILEQTLTINVIKIDISEPINVDFGYEQTETGVQITAIANDEESGIYGYQFSIDDGANYTDIQTSNKYEFNNLVSGTTYKLKVKAINNTYKNSGIKDNNSLESESKDFKFTNFKVKEVAYGLAIDTSDNLWSWGINSAGQLGNGTTDQNVHTLTKIDFEGQPQKICSNGTSKFVIDSNGDLWSWGSNSKGQLGNGNTTNVSIPTKLNLNFKVSDISCSSVSILALDIEGNLYAWGDNENSNLGVSSKIPTILASGTKFKDIDTYDQAHVAISVDGEVYRWGRESIQNGITKIVNKTPTKVFPDGRYKQAAISEKHIILLDMNNDIWLQGQNSDGQIGNGTTDYAASPISIMEDINIIDIELQDNTSYALDTEGNVWAWGSNNTGNLGNGTTVDSSVPVKVNIPTKVKSITQTYAIDENDYVWFWGSNVFGQSNDGSQNDVYNPIKIG